MNKYNLSSGFLTSLKSLKPLKSLMIFLTAATLVSCSDFDFDFTKKILEEPPLTSLSSEQIFADLEKTQAFLDGVYFQWKKTHVNRKTFFTMLGTDEIQQGEYQCVRESYSYYQGAFDRYDGGYDAWDNQYTAEIWNVRYPVVVLATEALGPLREKEKTATGSDSIKIKSCISQASFYRANVLFDLVRYWGEIPISDVVNGKIILSGRRTLSEVYGIIEADLKATEEYAPKKNDPANVRIPTVWAAKGMLAKIYMYAQEESGFRNLNKAKGLLQEIIEQGGYDLIMPYSKLWTGTDNTDLEVIYKLAFNNIWPDTNELQWYTGSRAVSNDRKCYMGGYDLALPTEYCYKNIWEEGDQRKDESIRYKFNEGGYTPASVSGFGEDQEAPHIKKFEDKRTNDFYNTGKDFFILRFSDILLLYAECLNEEGLTVDAVKIVNNRVRTRAWGGVLPAEAKWNEGMSKEEFKEKIMDERMRELCFENWRRMDLLRTGKFVEYINARNPWAKATGGPKVYQQRFPIPLVEIEQNPNIARSDQNPGF